MRRMIGLILLALALAQLGLRGMQRVRSDIPLWDFVSPLAATQAWLNGLDPYDLNSVVSTWRTTGLFADRDVSYFATVYPPSSLVMLAPFAEMPATIAIYAWLIAICVLLALQFAALIDLVGWCWRDARTIALVGASLFAAPLQFGILSGQISLPAISLGILAFWCVRNDRQRLAGVLLGLACALKPQVGAPFFAYFLLTRRFGVCKFAAILALAIVDVSLLGMQAMHVDWMTGWTHSIAQTRLAGGVNDYRFTGPYRDEIMDLKMLLISLPISARAMQLVIGTVALAMVVAFARWSWGAQRRTSTDELLTLGTLCAISLLPIYHRVYDATILTIALAWILNELDGPRRKFALAMLVPLTLFLVPFDIVASIAKRVGFVGEIAQTDWWQSIFAPHYAWGLFLISALLLRALSRQARIVELPAPTPARKFASGLN